MTSGNVPEVMAGRLVGMGDKKRTKQLQDFSISELVRSIVRRTIQESAARKGSFDFAPRLHSEAFSTMKLWHSQEQRQDKQRQESETFQGDLVMDGSRKECHFSFRNCFYADGQYTKNYES